ncbi:MAG: hypothetical protein CFH02_01269, partial [Alphaproteobacteria bacterium MarineAlpha3_Bin1]
MYLSDFHARMTGSGERAELLAKRFELACKRFCLKPARGDGYQMDTSSFKPPPNLLHPKPGNQLRLL